MECAVLLLQPYELFKPPNPAAYAVAMPLFSDTEGPVPEHVATSAAGVVMDELIAAARAGRVVYLTGPDDGPAAAAVVPIAVAEAGLAALAAQSNPQL